MENKSEAYKAGYDCGYSGKPDGKNCHVTFFLTPGLRDEWEAGKAEGERQKGLDDSLISDLKKGKEVTNG